MSAQKVALQVRPVRIHAGLPPPSLHNRNRTPSMPMKRTTAKTSAAATCTASARSLVRPVEPESPRNGDDGWREQRRDVPEGEIQDQQLARLERHALFIGEGGEPDRLESGEETRGPSRRQRPIVWAAPTLYACEHYQPVWSGSSRAHSFVTRECDSSLKIRAFSPGRPRAPSASHRPATHRR